MYNRYVRNDQGRYERIPVQDAPPDFEQSPPPPPPLEGAAFTQDGVGGPPPTGQPPPPNQPPPNQAPPNQPPPNQPPPPYGGQSGGFLSGILKKLNLENIDTGDLLLLVLLFLLFREGEDEELLIALGLLLIM